ncbi:MAG TPA: DNA/RNA non-specific endonuclease [Pyrinomonadaceae bacterium]
MVAPLNEYAFDPEVMKRAAANYRRRTPEREHKEHLVKERRYDEVDGKARLTKRVNRLISHLRETSLNAPNALPTEVQEVVERGAVSENEVNNLLFERIIGATRDFLGVAFLEMGTQSNRSVGRIVTNLGGGRFSFGTGFMVSPRLLLTNHHVLRSASDAAKSTVEFDFQLDRFGNPLTVDHYNLDPNSFFYNFQELDFALVAVSQQSKSGKQLNRGFNRLIQQEGKATQGLDCLNIIQHPRGEMKQIVIRENKLVDLPDNPNWAAHYAGDTEPGSSGSPVFNDQWELVALHHSGVPATDQAGNMLKIDGGIWRDGDDPAQVRYVANEGIRISRLVEHLRTANVKAHERALLQQVLDEGATPTPSERDETEDPTTTATTQPPVNGGAPQLNAAGGAVSLTIPLQITVSLGGAATASAQVATTDADDFDEKIDIDPNYGNRPGYDSQFLGFSVPLPKLTPAIKAAAATLNGGNSTELKYYHYSVIMNAKRRIAFVSAVNLDANPKFKHKREDGAEVWKQDPRIPSASQSRESNYANPKIDRGHLTRRADAGWGNTKKEAKLANDDTFHFTNCSPQHAIFNQSTQATSHGMLLWGNLEDHIASQARNNNKKVSVFNGPILRSNDQPHRGLLLPREFYKVVVFENDQGKPRALAFILSQASLIKDLPQEEFEVGPYEPFQVKITELEAKTKLNFGNLRNFDPLENNLNESLFEADTEAVPITSLESIVY